MTSKRANPPAATGGFGIHRDRQAAKFYDPENKPPLAEKQYFRTAWLSRRFRLSLATANAVADLHFGEVRQ